MEYDAQSDRVILFLGVLDPSGGSVEIETGGETWAYDYNTNTWENMEPTETPLGLLGPGMAYDAGSDRMIVFGGLDAESFVPLNDTWAYDFDSNSWTKMEPEDHPRGQNFCAMDYDESLDRVILFDNSGNTWSYDYGTDTWEELKEYVPAEGPSPRIYSDMVYDPRSERMILFGGVRPDSEYPHADTWAYDCSSNTWAEMAPDTYPSERGWHAAVYSTKEDRVVLFGGGPSREEFTDETWVYDPGANTWTNVAPTP